VSKKGAENIDPRTQNSSKKFLQKFSSAVKETGMLSFQEKLPVMNYDLKMNEMTSSVASPLN